MAYQLSQCARCDLTLRRRNDPVFTNTVLAKGSHRCEPAAKILDQAASGAEMFAKDRTFVHVRYISPIITPRAWMTVLQERTTTHDLVHRIIPAPEGAALVLSHRDDSEPDIPEVLMRVHDRIAALGDGPAPERMFATWDSARSVRTQSQGDATS